QYFTSKMNTYIIPNKTHPPTHTDRHTHTHTPHPEWSRESESRWRSVDCSGHVPGGRMTDPGSKKQGFKKCRSATFSIDGFSFTIGEQKDVHASVCVCARERESEREREREREKGRGEESEGEWCLAG